ncbi:MAG: competence protein ComEC family protein, partial [Muribaculaceae bacterium]|nr:competence protein ComEC family protein [Muribaculaceae bacterium]
MGAGIVVSYACELPWWSGIITITVALVVYLCILNLSKDPVSSFRFGKLHILWVVLLFLGIGLTDESLSRPLSLTEAFGSSVPDSLYCEVTGVLTKTYGERLDVVIDGTNGAKARIRSAASDVSPGDLIRIPSGRLQKVSSDTIVFGKGIRPMMKAAGIIYSGRIMPKSIIVVGKRGSLRYFFIGIREKIEITIERSHLSKATSDFLKAILMGDKTGLDEETRLTFSNGGMAHMLALSGLHIGILAGFLIFLMWPFRLFGHY